MKTLSYIIIGIWLASFATPFLHAEECDMPCCNTEVLCCDEAPVEPCPEMKSSQITPIPVAPSAGKEQTIPLGLSPSPSDGVHYEHIQFAPRTSNLFNPETIPLSRQNLPLLI